MAIDAPKVFISYSHDSELHKDWVLTLATRLMGNGVDVLLDQWDLNLGADLPRFIESGLTAADRVLAICTDNYVKKANDGIGGVGYEKMILTARMMENIGDATIIPVIRDTTGSHKVPTFLRTRKHIDFCNDLLYEAKYGELIGDIHGYRVKPRPPLGPNPFLAVPAAAPPLVSFGPARYVSPPTKGKITFDYSSNNGRYVLGAGDMAFETAWSSGSINAIHAYNDPPSIRTIAIAKGARDFSDIVDASMYDTSSRSQAPMLGEILVWQNTAGYYLATKIESLKCRGPTTPADEIVFSYVIAPNKSASFAAAA